MHIRHEIGGSAADQQRALLDVEILVRHGEAFVLPPRTGARPLARFRAQSRCRRCRPRASAGRANALHDGEVAGAFLELAVADLAVHDRGRAALGIGEGLRAADLLVEIGDGGLKSPNFLSSSAVRSRFSVSAKSAKARMATTAAVRASCSSCSFITAPSGGGAAARGKARLTAGRFNFYAGYKPLTFKGSRAYTRATANVSSACTGRHRRATHNEAGHLERPGR
jgi:hypothetical protein